MDFLPIAFRQLPIVLLPTATLPDDYTYICVIFFTKLTKTKDSYGD